MTTVANQMLRGVRFTVSKIRSLGNKGRIMPAIIKNLAKVINSSLFIRLATEINFSFISVSKSTVTKTNKVNGRGWVITSAGMQ